MGNTIEFDVELDSFDDDEIIEYAKKHLDMILIEEATADEAIDSLGRIKKYWGGVGPWDSVRQELKSLLEEDG